MRARNVRMSSRRIVILSGVAVALISQLIWAAGSAAASNAAMDRVAPAAASLTPISLLPCWPKVCQVLIPVTPTRVLDTRSGIGAPKAKVGPGHSVAVQVDGVAGLPTSGVAAVVVNITVTNATGAGNITGYADGTSEPGTSNVNYVVGQTIPNLAMLPVGADGKIKLTNNSAGSTDLIADISGYYPTGGLDVAGAYKPVTPDRLLDTRFGIGAGKAKVGAGASVALQVDGLAGLPTSGVESVVVNVTVTNPTSAGNISGYADGSTDPSTSNLNFTAGHTIPNLAVVPVGADGKIRLTNNSTGTVDLIADISGYYTFGGTVVAGSFFATAPRRVLDTRAGIGAPTAKVGANASIGVSVDGDQIYGSQPTSVIAAVVVNLTVTNPTSAGHITGYPDCASAPNTSNVNYTAGQTVANLAVLPVGADGKMRLLNGSAGSTDLIADMYGYYLQGSTVPHLGCTVFAWGWNGEGELGDGSTTNTDVPGPVDNLTGVTAIAAGDDTEYALKGDGTVAGWGHNQFGELGDGTTTNRTTPVQVHDLTGVTAIAAAGYATYALHGDGTVSAWGDNTDGELGDGTTIPRTTPIQVHNLTDITAIAGGSFTGYALRSDGTVWALGGNYYGNLGDGTTTNSTEPVQVRDLTDITAISSYGNTGYALRADGTVWAWGNNADGELGDGFTTSASIPVIVHNLTGITSIAGGLQAGYAVRKDGTVWAWGANFYGQLGDATTTQRTTPVQVHNLTGVTRITGGYYNGYAVDGWGDLWSWGYNYYGELGDDSTSFYRTTPVQAYALTGVIAIDGAGEALIQY